MTSFFVARWWDGVACAATIGLIAACSGKSTANGGAGGSTAGSGGASDGGSSQAGAGQSGGAGGVAQAGGSGGSSAGNAGGAGEDPGEEPEPLVPLASDEDEPYRIAIDDQYVYWTSRTALRRAPLAGGTASTLATSMTIGRIAAASGFVYFTDRANGIVARVDREGGSVEGIGTGTSPAEITLGAAGVYWSNAGISGGPPGDGSLVMTSFDGSTSVILAEELIQPAAVAVDDDFIYFSSSASGCSASSNGMSCWGGVSKVPLEGGAPEVVDAEGTPTEIVMHEERGLYWMVDSTVKRSPRGGGAVETVLTLARERSGPLAVDEDFLYLSSTGNGRVVRLPLDGGGLLPVAVDLGEVGGIAVDADWVYVAATSQGRILRIAKDGSAARPDGPITGPCPTPIGSTEEVTLTPREDENLELLALRIDEGQLTASQETYDRVVADMAAVRALDPALADIRYFAPHDGRTILLQPEELTLSSMRAGDYLAWDCLDDFYGLRSREIESYTSFSLVTVELDGIYDVGLLTSLYAQLPGIEFAEPNGSDGDGPTICASRIGSTYEYVVDTAGGDCLLGCTTRDAHRFVSAAPGEVEAGEVWNSDRDGAAPEWYLAACE